MMVTRNTIQKIKMALATANLILDLTLAGLAGNYALTANRQIRQDPHYKRAYACEQIETNLSHAADELGYTAPHWSIIMIPTGKGIRPLPMYHTATYPDPLTAREELGNALAWEQSDAQLGTDMPGLELRLASIIDGLPEENALQSYQGTPVDENTFGKERSELAYEAERVGESCKAYRSQIPEELKTMRTRATGLVAAGLGMGGGIIAYGIPNGFFQFSPKKREYDKRPDIAKRKR